LQVKDDQKLPDKLRFHTLHWVCKHHGVYKTRSTGKRHNVRSFAVGCPVQITVWYVPFCCCVFVCFSYLGPVCLFYVFGVFSPVCFELSVPVQVIAWKDSSPK